MGLGSITKGFDRPGSNGTAGNGFFLDNRFGRFSQRFFARRFLTGCFLDDYRRRHHIRSRAHPVPDLSTADPWLEAPFWIWTADEPERRRLFARRDRREVVISDRVRFEERLPLTDDGIAARAVARLGELAESGVKIRSRALVTTLWARLVLGDLFLHGIGGAKYDQVTDVLMHRFFGIDPPQFLVLSATLHLPVDREPGGVEALRAAEHRLRRLTYQPERYMNGTAGASSEPTPAAAELMTAKARWIRTPSTPENARERFDEIRRINGALGECLAPLREQLQDQRNRVQAALRAETVLAGREYAFCLFPEKTLRDFLFSLLPKSEEIGFDTR